MVLSNVKLLYKAWLQVDHTFVYEHSYLHFLKRIIR